MSPGLALSTVALAAAAGMWLALRVVPGADLNALPTRFRRRITWWQVHVRWIYVGCAGVAIGASLTHLSG